MIQQTAENGPEIAEELRNVVDHAEALLSALGDGGDAALAALRERVYASIDAARSRLTDLEEQAERAGSRLGAVAGEWIEENPWAAVAIGAGVGFVVGVMLARRGRAPAAVPDATPQ